MTKFNLFFAALLLTLAPLSASAMFTRMRSAFKPLAAATARRLTAPRIAGLAVGAGALYVTNNMRRVHALSEEEDAEIYAKFDEEKRRQKLAVERYKDDGRPIDVDPEKYPDLYLFIKKHQCSLELEGMLQKESGKVEIVWDDILKFSNIPYFDKGYRPRTFVRLEQARRMKLVFAQHGIKRFGVADKCLCSIGDEWHVIAAAVAAADDDESRKHSKEELEELTIVSAKTGYSDWKKHNVILSKDGRRIIVDTENRSFDLHVKLSLNGAMVEEGVTREWFDQQVNKHQKKHDFPLENPLYDDPEINFGRAKRQLEDWRNERAQKKDQQ